MVRALLCLQENIGHKSRQESALPERSGLRVSMSASFRQYIIKLFSPAPDALCTAS